MRGERKLTLEMTEQEVRTLIRFKETLYELGFEDMNYVSDLIYEFADMPIRHRMMIPMSNCEELEVKIIDKECE